MRILLLFLGGLWSLNTLLAQDNLYLNNQTYTHQELIIEYLRLQKEFPNQCKLLNAGPTDCGKHLHLFVINREGHFSPEALDRNKETVVLVNNAIHPGEPCGVDACLKLSKEWLKNKKIPKNLTLLIIPMYNLGGATNRNCCSRANQNGPEEYGFRGNARNLDLNRDFIKLDSENAQSFVQIFRAWNPDLFVDTHTSNGADYQHTMTLITSQLDKLAPELRTFTKNELQPHLFSKMKKKGYGMIPYMHTVGSTPDDGIKDYLETPRYSTGYTAQFNCIGFVTEAHMLKPFKDRVEATYQFLNILSLYASKNAQEIIQTRHQAIVSMEQQKHFPYHFVLDTTRYDSIFFRGYEAKYKPSKVTGQLRLYYDRNAPYEKYIPYFNHYRAQGELEAPKYYVLPQAWKEVVKRLKVNKVPMVQLKSDTTITVSANYIQHYETVSAPYEGHYLHKNVEISTKTISVQFYKGDYLIEARGECKRFVIESLEAQHPDSYFCWNFFDEVLMQKEWFSSYVFEDKAAELLESDPQLKKEFEKKKKEDPQFAQNAWQQLYFIYTQSDNYERSHNRVPVYKIY